MKGCTARTHTCIRFPVGQEVFTRCGRRAFVHLGARYEIYVVTFWHICVGEKLRHACKRLGLFHCLSFAYFVYIFVVLVLFQHFAFLKI